tara:strand:- start:1953 stop:2315 length:363 start_codon:yes stop_codon:yes gene_type:complete
MKHDEKVSQVVEEDGETILSDGPIWVRITEFGIENAKKGSPNLEQLQEAVGGYIESVERYMSSGMRSELEDSRMYGREICAVYVNEEGRMRAMEYNPFATAICGLSVVGPAVIVFHGRSD